MIVVLKPGMLASVQDLGRHGHRQRGICPGGALDTLALTMANRLVYWMHGAEGPAKEADEHDKKLQSAAV